MASERQNISRIAALLRLSYEDEMTDDVRDQIREHCVALRDICDALSKALAEARAEGARDAAPASTLKPWHDTPVHACKDGTPAPGPIAPVLDHPADVGDVRALRCCACGEAWVEDDERKVVHAWWSAGAWRGQNDG